MRAEKVDEALAGYPEAVSRTEYLTQQNALLRDALRLALAQMPNDEVSLSQQLTGMPHGTKISDPTGRLGMWFAEGHETWTVGQIRAEIAQNEREIASLRWMIVFVPAWLKALNDKESALIRWKYFDRLSWAEIGRKVYMTYGTRYGKAGIYKLLAAAKDRIYRAAK